MHRIIMPFKMINSFSFIKSWEKQTTAGTWLKPKFLILIGTKNVELIFRLSKSYLAHSSLAISISMEIKNSPLSSLHVKRG